MSDQAHDALVEKTFEDRRQCAGKLGELVNVLRHRRAAELQLARRAKRAVDAAIAPQKPPPDDSPDFGDDDIPF